MTPIKKGDILVCIGKKDRQFRGMVGTVVELTKEGLIRLRPNRPENFKDKMDGDTVLLHVESTAKEI